MGRSENVDEYDGITYPEGKKEEAARLPRTERLGHRGCQATPMGGKGRRDTKRTVSGVVS